MSNKIVKMKPKSKSEKEYKSGSDITFEKCGLDANMNFLQAPVCECGCGNYMYIVAKDDELPKICATLVSEEECNHCAVIAIDSNGGVVCAFKTGERTEENPDNVSVFQNLEPLDDYTRIGELINSLANEFTLHQYGLMHSPENGKCYIIMD